MNKRVCPKCGEPSDYNFCTECGAKITPICPVCWRKGNKPNNCLEEKCPGFAYRPSLV